ncbi:MAG TPA: AAA family ATPase [Chloroflexota bacterium]
MFLKRLELVGFKSFAPRTVTELLPGIVVVVGPNGSGKSNIADAVRWVLGEQSSKAVRARKPEEVIFAGSATRPQLGMAEASLILDNSDASLPIEYAEVRVTRRLYRSGDSEYLLNGAKVRLRDITQLLLHAGLSTDSYSVIGQGSIDELILQRPEERRIAFESAADIRRHQLRLNETRSKLAATEANLTRVQDVIAELAPHVRRLKTQADRAARADTMRGELHDVLVRFFRARLALALAEQHTSDEQLHVASQAVERAESETLLAENALNQLDASLASFDDQLATLRPRVESYREQAAATERALAVARERAAGIEERRATTHSDVERLSAQSQRLARDEAAHLFDEPSTADEPDPSTSIELAHARLIELQPTLDAAQAERRQLAQQRDALEAQMTEAESRLRQIEQQLHTLESSLAVDQARQTDRATRIAALDEQLAESTVKHTHLTELLAQAEAERGVAVERHARASEADRAAADALRSTSQVADRLHGSLMALGGAELSGEQRATLPADWPALLSDLPVIGLAGELGTRIRPIDRLMRAYLLRIVVLGDDTSAREAYRRLSTALTAETPGWAVLSLDGVLLTPAGEQPLAEAAEGSAFADWRRQVRQLESELAAAERARGAAAVTVEGAHAELERAEQAAQASRDAAQAVTTELDQLTRSRRILQSELDDLRTEHERSAADADQRQAERRTLAQRVQSSVAALGAARQHREALAERLQIVDARVATLTEQVNQAHADVVAREAAGAQREAERAAQAALHGRIQAELTATRLDLEGASNRARQLAVQADELAERERALIEEVQATLLELAPMEEQLSSAEQRRLELLAERRARELRLAELRGAARQAHERREELHVHAQRATDELERLRAEIDETVELESDLPGGAAWAAQLHLEGGEVPEPSLDLEAMRRRIALLQRELRVVGGVADSVVEEFREISQRHDFLVHQSDDLRVAMGELQHAAAELETHMRERFAAVFQAMQTAFQECFAQLFGGGEAQLVLTQPNDLLTSGVDILARPPGKKLQGLLSLSGGERALTIVALLFGLLRVNPTPFCVLDEVDAALDEANVQRFVNLLADFARAIQFIVVTHNRATMDRADALYGVSMDTHGVSRIFSIAPRDIARPLVGSATPTPDPRPLAPEK